MLRPKDPALLLLTDVDPKDVEDLASAMGKRNARPDQIASSWPVVSVEKQLSDSRAAYKAHRRDFRRARRQKVSDRLNRVGAYVFTGGLLTLGVTSGVGFIAIGGGIGVASVLAMEVTDRSEKHRLRRARDVNAALTRNQMDRVAETIKALERTLGVDEDSRSRKIEQHFKVDPTDLRDALTTFAEKYADSVKPGHPLHDAGLGERPAAFGVARDRWDEALGTAVVAATDGTWDTPVTQALIRGAAADVAANRTKQDFGIV